MTDELSLHAFLLAHKLERYHHAFIDQGWDDLQYLHHLNQAQLEDVAVSVGMKPGHAEKLIFYIVNGDGMLSSMPLTLPAPAPAQHALPPPSPLVQDSAPMAGSSAAEAKTRTERLAAIRSHTLQKQPAPKRAKVGRVAEGLGNGAGAALVANRSNATDPRGAAADAASPPDAAAQEMVRPDALEAKRLRKEEVKEAKARAAAEKAAKREAEAVAAAERRMSEEIENSYSTSRPLSHLGALLLDGVDAGEDLRAVGKTVWLSREADAVAANGRGAWSPADFRVRITKVNRTEQTFEAEAVPPGRQGLSGAPLSQIARIVLAPRELRAAEQGHKRDLLRQAAAFDVERARAARLEGLDEEEAERVRAQRAAKSESGRHRTERERQALGWWPERTEAEKEAEKEARGCTQIVVRQSVNGGGRILQSDLPNDLADDAEAVDVWRTAIECKRRRLPCDVWVRGWRMRLLSRSMGSDHIDIYIRAPDMRPEDMSNRHQTHDTIRSFVHLERKLRERLENGESSGAGCAAVPMVQAHVYVGANGVNLGLQVHASAATTSAATSAASAGSSTQDHSDGPMPMEVDGAPAAATGTETPDLRSQ